MTEKPRAAVPRRRPGPRLSLGAGPRPSPGSGQETLRAPLSVGRIGGKVRGEGAFPLVAILEQLRLVVEQFLPRLGGIFEVRALDDRVDRAGFLAQPAIDAFDHVDVVAGGAAAAVLARLGLDRDGERRADRLAQFAGDAALLAVRIAAQRMLAAEAGAQRVLLIGVIDRRLGLEEIFQRQPVRLDELPEEERLNPVCDHWRVSKYWRGRTMPAQEVSF